MSVNTASVASREPNRGPAILAVTWAECAVALLLVSLRVFARGYLIRNFGMDDWVIIVAMILALVCSSLATVGVYYGTGRHFLSLNATAQVLAVKYNWLSQPFHVLSAGVGKISVALLLLRIMAKNKVREWFLYTIMALLVIINVICVAFILAQCTPTRKLWDTKVGGKCFEPHVQQYVGFFQASFSSFSDFVLALFPILIIYKLQMRLLVKIGLGCAMSLGLIATGAAIVKTVQLQHLTARSDYTYDTSDLAIWLATEQYAVIIAACVPTLRPLLPMLTKGLSTHKSRDAYTSSRNMSKKGYRVHDSEDAHHLQILAPSRTYANGNISSDSTSRKTPRDLDLEREDAALPWPEPNRIMKTTKVDVSVRDNSCTETGQALTQGGTTTYGENDVQAPYYTLQ